MNLHPLIKGILTYIPFVSKLTQRKTGGTISARYCYSIWLRHIVMAKKNGLNPFPKVIAELGPGDSIGIGLAALIGGSERYYAFDVVETINANRNLKIFEELVELFKNKSQIPDENEFPSAKPQLEIYNFPDEIYTEDMLRNLLSVSRLNKIRYSIININAEDSVIHYKVPWGDKNILQKNSIDMIYSQAVLEHVNDLDYTYKAMQDWLKNTGFISHQIDFKSHGLTTEWNGHWKYSDLMWKIIRGKRVHFLNRVPHSIHLEILNKLKFKIICDEKYMLESKLKKNQLSDKYRSISDDDLVTSGAFIQAIKMI